MSGHRYCWYHMFYEHVHKNAQLQRWNYSYCSGSEAVFINNTLLTAAPYYISSVRDYSVRLSNYITVTFTFWMFSFSLVYLTQWERGLYIPHICKMWRISSPGLISILVLDRVGLFAVLPGVRSGCGGCESFKTTCDWLCSSVITFVE